MVDREARQEYAELVRQFISGRMTQNEYDQKYFAIRFHKKDFAVPEIRDALDALFEAAQPEKMTTQWKLDSEA